MAVVREQERIDNAARSKSRSIARLKAGYYVFQASTGYRYVKDKSGNAGRVLGGKVLIRDEPAATIIA